MSGIPRAILTWLIMMLILISAWGWDDLRTFAAVWPRLLLLPVWLGLSIYGTLHNTHTSGSSGKKEIRGHRTAFWFFLPTLTLWFLFLPYADRFNLKTVSSEAWRWIGLILYAGMHWLRIESIRAQGKQFSMAVAIQEGHQLATNGPYRWMRHPAYTGVIGMVLGISLVFANLIVGLGATAVVWFWMETRIWDEERLLLGEFGNDYSNYQKKTRKLIPLIY